MTSIRRCLGVFSLAALSGFVSSCCTTSKPQSVHAFGDNGEDCAGAKDHNIDIGSHVSCKWVYLKSNSSGKGNTVNWSTTAPGMNVKIVFEHGGPFQSPLNCPGDQKVCHAGPLDPSVKGDSSVDYHYKAYLCSDANNCGQEIDPGIIIVP